MRYGGGSGVGHGGTGGVGGWGSNNTSVGDGQSSGEDDNLEREKIVGS